MNRNPTRNRLNDLFPDWLLGQETVSYGPVGAIASGISTTDYPEFSKFIEENAFAADLLYYGRSCSKLASVTLTAPLSATHTEQYTTDNTAAAKILAAMILANFGEDWERLISALNIEYNPIQNYDSTEQIDETRTTNRTDTAKTTTKIEGTNSVNESSSDKHTGTDTVTHGGTISYQEGGTDKQVSDFGERQTTMEKAGTELVTHGGTTTTTNQHPDNETTQTTESYPADNPLTVSTKENGTVQETETGGTVNKKWGFDSTVPVAAEMDTTTSGDGESGSKTTETSYNGRITDEVTTGEKTTTVEHTFQGEDTETVNHGETVDTTFNGRTDTQTETSHTDTQTTTYGKTNTETRNATDSTEYGEVITRAGETSGTNTQDTTQNQEGTGETTDQFHHTMNRSGNIGVTTSQQMLESEYELRKKHFIFQVFEDLDSILTLPIFM